MAVYENYKLKFVNKKVEIGNGRIDKSPQGIEEHRPYIGFLYSPLSIYLYICGSSGGPKLIDEIIVALDDALNGNIGDPDISIEMTKATILNNTTVEIKEDNTNNVITLPIVDFKAILLEYKDFLNTPPLNGTML